MSQAHSETNTPGTRGGPGGHDQKLVIKRRKNAEKSPFFVKKNYLKKYFLHIYSSYAKILGETNFQPREIPRSGSKVKDGKEKERRETEIW